MIFGPPQFFIRSLNRNFSIRLFSTSAKFIDKQKTKVHAGNGGNGSAAFARDNFNPRGRADGGNGGNGGSVIFYPYEELSDLSHIKGTYKAINGVNGGSNGMYGAHGTDVRIPVPLGTVIYRLEDEKRTRIADMDFPTSPSVVAAKGGKGGRGNHSLRSNNHEYEHGAPGEVLTYELDLNVIADFGLVGLPNAGKSSFLSCISKATPKIAAYPFTTLDPSVGMVELSNFKKVSVADIPGLIEGAHKNVGLGHEFLKHVSKSKHIFYVVDISSLDPVSDLLTIIREVELYDRKLHSRAAAVIANKVDLLEPNSVAIQSLQQAAALPVFTISAKRGIGIERVIKFLSSQ